MNCAATTSARCSRVITSTGPATSARSSPPSGYNDTINWRGTTAASAGTSLRTRPGHGALHRELRPDRVEAQRLRNNLHASGQIPCLLALLGRLLADTPRRRRAEVVATRARGTPATSGQCRGRGPGIRCGRAAHRLARTSRAVAAAAAEYARGLGGPDFARQGRHAASRWRIALVRPRGPPAASRRSKRRRTLPPPAGSLRVQ